MNAKPAMNQKDYHIIRLLLDEKYNIHQTRYKI